jgi:type I restriction enzyme S subunit
MSWKKYKLSELGDFKNGANYPKGSYGSGTKIVNVKDLFRGRYIQYENLDELTPNALKDKSIYLVSHGDLLFTRSSLVKSGAGMVAMAHKPTEEVLFCGFIIRYRPNNKKVNPLFLLYLLRSPNYRKLFTDSSVQTNISNINQETLGNIEVEIPEVSEQQNLIKILDSIDSKIEINNLINFNLENVAKLIYDYWFIQFDFPDINCKPYKSSGGKMVWNADLKREIPIGWDVVAVGDLLIKFSDKSTHIESKQIIKRGRFPVITQDNGDFVAGYTNEINPIVDLPLIVFGDHSCTLRYVDFPFFRGADGTQIMKFNDNLPFYMYLFLKRFINQIPGFGKYERHYKYLKEFKVAIPTSNVLSDFNKIQTQLFEKISNARMENYELICLRDWLLPMLTNGQVKLKL